MNDTAVFVFFPEWLDADDGARLLTTGLAAASVGRWGCMVIWGMMCALSLCDIGSVLQRAGVVLTTFLITVMHCGWVVFALLVNGQKVRVRDARTMFTAVNMSWAGLALLVLGLAITAHVVCPLRQSAQLARDNDGGALSAMITCGLAMVLLLVTAQAVSSAVASVILQFVLSLFLTWVFIVALLLTSVPLKKNRVLLGLAALVCLGTAALLFALIMLANELSDPVRVDIGLVALWLVETQVLVTGTVWLHMCRADRSAEVARRPSTASAMVAQHARSSVSTHSSGEDADSKA